MSAFLDLYEPLDVIGNGSFGIIRKVKRKSDGLIFARKELHFERMSERDRKQIVAEVNILKDLQHEHIVRYHDRHVDRDAGILYIIMEYCGGGDLSTVIKQSGKQSRPIPEDVIWNYFMQILLALCHCHHPNGGGTGPNAKVEASRRPQILHRDLKPDNVFLDAANNVKLGDFGLSKALAQSSFANTYVGTPYYMSPELMQEKAYDSKSDIWSLGCLIYELCALKPPFHEAKTHNELSILIRNGRIPPLPRGYSQSLFGVIKAMLNLNPAMRPSAAQLLQHERLELVLKVAETEKMLSTVKAHKNTMITREHELAKREQAIVERETHLTSLFAQKDTEISQLQHLVSSLQLQLSQSQSHAQHLQTQLSQTAQITPQEVDQAIKRAIARREEELRVHLVKHEREVRESMAKREEEIMEAVTKREAEVCAAWAKREAEVRAEVVVSIESVEARIKWIQAKEEEMKDEEDRLEVMREDLEERERELDERAKKAPSPAPRKAVFEDIENIEPASSPVPTITFETPAASRRHRLFESFETTPRPANRVQSLPALETPITRPSYTDFLPSAMKGVVLTATGEPLATPSPAELASLFNASPPVGLNFGKIFDFDKANEEQETLPAIQFPGDQSDDDEEEEAALPPSPTARKEKELIRRSSRDSHSSNSTPSTGNVGGNPLAHSAAAPSSATRIRRPSLRKTSSVPANVFEQKTRRRSVSREPTSGRRTSGVGASESSNSVASSSSAGSSTSGSAVVQAKPLAHPHLASTASSSKVSSNSSTKRVPSGSSSSNGITRTTSVESTPKYDLADEENLPSPFLKRVSRSKSSTTTTSSSSKEPTSESSSTPSSSVAAERPGSAVKTISRKRPSAGNMLRTVAAANVVKGKMATSSGGLGTVGRAGKV